MTEEESTIQIGMMAAADSLYFGFGWDADAGVGSGLPLPLRMSLEMSTSDFALRKWAEEALSVSMGRPPFSKNFSVAIMAMGYRRDGGGGEGKGEKEKDGGRKSEKRERE